MPDGRHQRPDRNQVVAHLLDHNLRQHNEIDGNRDGTWASGGKSANELLMTSTNSPGPPPVVAVVKLPANVMAVVNPDSQPSRSRRSMVTRPECPRSAMCVCVCVVVCVCVDRMVRPGQDQISGQTSVAIPPTRSSWSIMVGATSGRRTTASESCGARASRSSWRPTRLTATDRAGAACGRGTGEPHPISAMHGRSVADLLDAVMTDATGGIGAVGARRRYYVIIAPDQQT